MNHHLELKKKLLSTPQIYVTLQTKENGELSTFVLQKNLQDDNFEKKLYFDSWSSKNCKNFLILQVL